MFEYLGVLIAVIMGLALTHLLRGLAKLIHMRHTVKPWWPHIVWTVNIIIYVLTIWWGMFWWNGLHDWTIQRFFFIVLYCIVLFLLASLLYPPEFPQDLDCEQYFFANKNWFFGILVAVVLLDVPETLSKSVVHLRDVPETYVILMPVLLGICVAGIVSSSRKLHSALALLWLVAIVSYDTLSAMDRIVAR